MTAGQMLKVAIGLLIIGTIYCQLYCLIAFRHMNNGLMPLSASVAWSIAGLLPWLGCLELCKRLPPSRGKAVIWAAIFVAVAALSIILEAGIDQLTGVHQTRPLGMQIAAQMPAAGLTLAFLLIGAPSAWDSHEQRTEGFGDALNAIASRARMIDLIEAAGNYVEVHSDGATALHRVTMHELEQQLDPRSFVRIHRSVIVNRDAIEAIVSLSGTPAVRLRDGRILKTGSRYRANLRAPAVRG